MSAALGGTIYIFVCACTRLALKGTRLLQVKGFCYFKCYYALIHCINIVSARIKYFNEVKVNAS